MHKTLPSDTVCSYCIHGQIYGQVFPISSCHRDVQSPSRRTMSSSIRQPWETKWSTGFMFRVSRTIYVNVDSPNQGFPYFNFLGGGQLKKSPCRRWDNVPNFHGRSFKLPVLISLTVRMKNLYEFLFCYVSVMINIQFPKDTLRWGEMRKSTE